MRVSLPEFEYTSKTPQDPGTKKIGHSLVKNTGMPDMNVA
jgi:hypothetical protein